VHGPHVVGALVSLVYYKDILEEGKRNPTKLLRMLGLLKFHGQKIVLADYETMHQVQCVMCTKVEDKDKLLGQI
jgi:hypothetical protein